MTVGAIDNRINKIILLLSMVGVDNRIFDHGHDKRYTIYLKQ